MKLTFSSMKHSGRHLGNVLGYRVLQDEEIDDKLYIMQRRKNVRRIFIIAIALSVLIVLVMLIGSRLGLFAMELLEQMVFVGEVFLVLGGFAYWSTVIIREQWEQLYQPFYLGFWGVVFGEFTYLACRTENTSISLALFLMEVLLLGGVPRLTGKERVLCMFGFLLTATVINWKQNLMWQEMSCMATWGFLGWYLSKVRYDSYIRECKQRKRLQMALFDAETDPMTKLLNRRGLERSLFTIVPHCVRNEVPVAVVLLDIDNFKQYNDTFGHLDGDECIKKVADEIRGATRRRTDLAARIGGEEFLMFLTGLTEEAAKNWALNLQESIERLGIQHSSQNFTDIVTVSIGIQCGKITRGEESIQCLQERADEELYNAKENGRACLSINGSCYRSKKMEEENEKKWLVEKKQA